MKVYKLMVGMMNSKIREPLGLNYQPILIIVQDHTSPDRYPNIVETPADFLTLHLRLGVRILVKMRSVIIAHVRAACVRTVNVWKL